MKRGPLTWWFYSIFCLFSTSILFFPNYSKWFPGFTFNITLKKMVPRNYYVYSVCAALAHQWRPEGTLWE